MAGKTKIVNARLVGSGTASPETTKAPWRWFEVSSTHPESTPLRIALVARGLKLLPTKVKVQKSKVCCPPLATTQY
jgi:hypothetical protein